MFITVCIVDRWIKLISIWKCNAITTTATTSPAFQLMASTCCCSFAFYLLVSRLTQQAYNCDGITCAPDYLQKCKCMLWFNRISRRQRPMPECIHAAQTNWIRYRNTDTNEQQQRIGVTYFGGFVVLAPFSRRRIAILQWPLEMHTSFCSAVWVEWNERNSLSRGHLCFFFV